MFRQNCWSQLKQQRLSDDFTRSGAGSVTRHAFVMFTNISVLKCACVS